MFNDKTILVTGGTGSFGEQFIETILLRYEPKKIIVYSRDELKQLNMRGKRLFAEKEKVLRYFIGDVRDRERLMLAFEGVDYIVHAAALKQVPTAEYNPFEAVKTNVLGGQNVVEAALARNVIKVIALSTDKAVAPINLYGATKLTSDKIFVAANNYSSKQTLFSVVRYGNVMGSRGSVIPLFLEKKNEGILPITDPRMTRFNITLEEGADFVLKCFEKMWGGEIFVPKIPSYRILDLADAIAPEAERKIIDIRPGEKLHEELITEGESRTSIEFNENFVILPDTRYLPWNSEDYIRESNDKSGKRCPEGFRYSSAENERFLSVEQLHELIARHVEGGDILDSKSS
jgi:UDP-N-acetylglucosamine 4,6-dehydratase (inverting)